VYEEGEECIDLDCRHHNGKINNYYLKEAEIRSRLQKVVEERNDQIEETYDHPIKYKYNIGEQPLNLWK
jgi:hypothetical protein